MRMPSLASLLDLSAPPFPDLLSGLLPPDVNDAIEQPVAMLPAIAADPLGLPLPMLPGTGFQPVLRFSPQPEKKVETIEEQPEKEAAAVPLASGPVCVIVPLQFEPPIKKPGSPPNED